MQRKNSITEEITQSIEAKQKLMQYCSDDIYDIAIKLAEVIKSGNKIMLCGNGGSAADSQHIAAELVVRLRSEVNRPAIPAMALTVDTSILTAGGNDLGFDNIFARGVEAFGQKGDALIAISTSGNSENVLRAVDMAKKKGVIAIGLLGNEGGKLKSECDDFVVVPSNVTARIQECHILIGHIWCRIIEEINYL
ncbi:MAG: phosphoheptose isomerase [Ignavibacteriae bacterium HGW-Ignavibacteriae-4]|jgi:D-sedoheptulose 7-phosphate isomerase|nr:MAG: phosphoheptose isomerase [Ignavibacteriae bacterium HGW-Ignavibacteriae-4]